MSILKFFKIAWAVFDSFMIFMIFVLISVMIYGSESNMLNFRDNRSVGLAFRKSRWSSKPDFSSSRQVVSMAPVAYERARASQIARKMVSTGIKRLPSRQVLDMRENDRQYEIRFSLPSDVGEESLNVDVAGNILTLMMKSGERTFMRRIRIPCDYAQECSLNHYVSNQVLFVKITK